MDVPGNQVTGVPVKQPPSFAHNENARWLAQVDAPTLVECWRTAPYLHDGSAATTREVLTTANPNDKHGKTSQLTADQLNDLVEYLLSL